MGTKLTLTFLKDETPTLYMFISVICFPDGHKKIIQAILSMLLNQVSFKSPAGWLADWLVD